jgi:anaerobic ribonucleoside-triphosphate reductase
LNTKYIEYQFVNIVNSHERNQPNMNSTIKVAAKVAEELNQSNKNSDTKWHSTHKSKIRRVLKEKMGKQIMHGQYIRSMDRQLFSMEDTFLWLSTGDLKGETESEIIEA